MAEELFFILSMERTRDGKTCVWWRPEGNGYTSSLGEAGRYTREAAIRCSDPPRHLAVPCSVVDVPAGRAKRFATKALRESRFDKPASPAAPEPMVAEPWEPAYTPHGPDLEDG